MKKLCVLILAMLMVLTGCAGKEKIRDASVRKTVCPYKINHKRDFVEITLRDGKKQDLLWDVQMNPEGICQLKQIKTTKARTVKYCVTGGEDGAALLTFTAAKQDQPASFVLYLLVNVDQKGKVTISDYQHQDLSSASVEEDGLQYKWYVDVDGVLHFDFFNNEDSWHVSSDSDDVCDISNKLSTPSGCTFSAKAKSKGKCSVVLMGKTTQRRVDVTIKVDKEGNMEVTSVQEQ